MTPKRKTTLGRILATIVLGWALSTFAAPAHAEREALARARTWGYQLAEIDPEAISRVPYDVIVIDYARDGSAETRLTRRELEKLKTKPDGSRRIVLSYLSVGEAETYRAYWKWWWTWLGWLVGPSWLGRENPEWRGNYAVRYWDKGWQDIIAGPGGSYLGQIIEAGFDGVWLDKVDSSVERIGRERPDPKADMVQFVTRIAKRARSDKPGFLIVPQNGEELLESTAYRQLIDGIGKEDILYGEPTDKKPTPEAIQAKRIPPLKLLTAEGKPVLAVEYLDDPAAIRAARERLESLGFVPHFADRELATMRVGDLPGSPGKGRRRKGN